jgi:hypothetical protein
MISPTVEKRYGSTTFPLTSERFFWPENPSESMESLLAGKPWVVAA